MNSYRIIEYIHHLPSQENVACCAASASLLASEILLKNDVKFSRLFPYYLSRKMHNRIGQSGTELKDVLEVMKIYGRATDKTWPFTSNRVDAEPSRAAYQEAENYKLCSYESIGIESFKDYLHKRIPIIVGVRTGRMFWKLKGELSKQVYKKVNDTDNRVYRSHAITIIGYDAIHNGSWIVANSSGREWGDSGLGILPYECNEDIGEAYVISEFQK